MKNKGIILSLFLCVSILQSCSFDTPENYFDRTTLNVNKYSYMGAEDFKRMIETQNQNALYAEVDGEVIPSDNFEAHVKTVKINGLETDIESIEKLAVTDDTKEMIAASLEVFNFIKSKYETDYIKIAKLMDKKVPQEILDKAIWEFEENNLPALDEKMQVLYDKALPYAKENGIEVTFY